MYKKSHEPEYVLKRTKIDLECYSENIVVILQLLKLGIDLGLLIDENIEKKIIEFSRLLKKNISRLRIEGLTHIPHPSIEITRKLSMNGFKVS